MRISGISNNFSAPAFKSLYIKGDAAKSIATLSEDENTRDTYDLCMKYMKDFAKDRSILISAYDSETGEGVRIQELEPETLEPKKNIAHNKTDFIQGLYSAIRRLGKQDFVRVTKTDCQKLAAPRVVHHKERAVIDAEELNKLA